MAKPNMNTRQTDGGGNSYWRPPVPPPAPAKKVQPKPIKPKVPPPATGTNVRGPDPDFPKSKLDDVKTYDLFGNIGDFFGNWFDQIRNRNSKGYYQPTAADLMRMGGYDYKPSQYSPEVVFANPVFANFPPKKSPNAVEDPYYYNTAHDPNVKPYIPPPDYWYPNFERYGAPQQDLNKKVGTEQAIDESRYNNSHSMRVFDTPKNTAQDYFDRIVINGRTYSVPNQALNFASDYPWETTSWWYEPPADFKGSPLWKEKYADSGVYSDDSPPSGGDGGGGGGGGGGWTGGYGSGNYSSKPAYPMQGYQQDPAIFYQQLVKWVI
jgi:hypothetical protein